MDCTDSNTEDSSLTFFSSNSALIMPLKSFEDERGIITDILQFDVPTVDAVTRIFSNKGAIRGNHFHKQTHQWTYVVKGLTRVVSQKEGEQSIELTAGCGDVIYHAPGEAHAFEAKENTTWLVFTKGPRAGNNYESDTFRLEIPLI